MQHKLLKPSKMDDNDTTGLRDAEPYRFLYDSKGMILPHSILGSKEHFRSYVEARGELGLLEKIPNSGHPFEINKHESNEGGNQRKVPSCVQTNALHNWNTHMMLRRSQHDNLSGLLRRPAQNLLMNRTDRFRETQERREMLNQVLPLVHSGYGHSVGSGFWRLPQHYGDETSGIASTLTKTERGVREPTTQVGIPTSIRQQSGLKEEDTGNDASCAWDQSIYLKQQYHMLGEVIQDLDFSRKDISKLEVIGSSEPFCCASSKNTNEEEEPTDEDITLKSNDVKVMEPESKHLPVPALRIAGQLANWTGNSNANQGQIGINTTLLFESPTGKLQTSHIEIHNEGITAIFYTWEQRPLPHPFPHLLPRTMTPDCFYFNSSSGVIHPGETQIVKYIFKSDKPGLQTELWQLNTHPILLQGAPIQVTLRGVALYQDSAAGQRLYIEKRLEKKITVQVCRSIVYNLVKIIDTSERPSSAAELCETEEQEFLRKNPKICYKNQPVEELKKLWLKVKAESTWDLSVGGLRQALLSLPDDEVEGVCLNPETGLAQLNSLLLQLTDPSPELQHPTGAALRQLMWRDLVDTMTSEAVRLTHLLHLPEKDTWMDKNKSPKEEVLEEEVLSDQEVTASFNEEKSSEEGDVEKTMVKSKTEVAPVKHEDRKKGKGSRTDLGKPRKDRHNKEADLQLQEEASEDLASDANMTNIYTRVLHQKTYGLIENLVESLCDVTEELKLPADITL